MARSYHADLLPSEVAVLNVDHFKVPDPSARFSRQHIVLDCTDPAAAIYYTTDGSEATGDSAIEYTTPFLPAGDCTVRFIARRPNYHDSEEITYVFVIEDNRVATPVISETDGHIVMTSATEGAEIHYTV
ncbi:MAG: chitobiase/beta-hexosaminidase C-terminal domain-containing protein, partial [Muribaculaceae bacterium]|nr:chitobiase/beta-hexosaminidase C-terminal domain-containing protein [Muribaculaceae bacterium]